MRSLVLLQHEELYSGGKDILASALDDNDQPLICQYEQGQLQFLRGAQLLGTHPCPGRPSRIFFSYLASRAELSLITGDGEIGCLRLEDEGSGLEILGDIEGGVSAASWSPEEDLLTLATSDGKLLLLDSSFEVVSEGALRPSGYGAEAPISLGWGDKTTQFHGSIGKTAARQQRQEQPLDWLDTEKDTADARISWRGDGAHFCVSTRDTDDQGRLHRVIRTYARSGEHQSTSEPTPGMEDALAWQPSGSLISSVQRSEVEGRIQRDVIFFERNGLRRYEFGVGGAEVRKLVWNSDSSFLAVWLGSGSQSSVRLYCRSNYQWYPKHETRQLVDVRDVRWHAERPLHLYVTTSSAVESFVFAQRVIRAPHQPARDIGLVGSIDGDKLLVTELGKALIPPPMSGYQLATQGQLSLVDAAFDPNGSYVAGLDAAGAVHIWLGKQSAPIAVKSLDMSHAVARQVAIFSTEDKVHVVVLLTTPSSTVVYGVLLDIKSAAWTDWERLAKGDFRVVQAWSAGFVAQGGDGHCEIYEGFQNTGSAQLPAVCAQLCVFEGIQPLTVCGLATDSRLCISTSDTPVATNATSIALCDNLLLYTTSASELHFVDLLSSDMAFQPRSVERGARLVTCVPSKMLTILQMPRGNLESINPRPLVYARLRSFLADKRYGEAFRVCRKHRIDLNVLCDFDEPLFLASIDAILGALPNADDVNLLLTSFNDADSSKILHGGNPVVDGAKGKGNRLLSAFLEAFVRRNMSGYVTSILTAQVRKDPPDYEAALQTLARLKETGQTQALEDAVSYIFFLVPNSDKLFDTALGMYDLKLALLVAQHSQKDPKEFLPWLRELQALPVHARRFRIDDSLKRYSKALAHLAESSSADAFHDAKAYTIKYRLFDDALRLYAQQPPRLKTILELRGDYLMERGKPLLASSDFALACNPARQVDALRAALAWRPLFALLLSPRSPKPANRSFIVSLAIQVADELASQKRHAEAARVRLDYAQDVPGAVGELCQAGEWAEASRTANLYSRNDLLLSAIAPAALETCLALLQTIEEIRTQAVKQVARLDELQQNREKERTAGLDDEDAADDFEMASDDSTAVVSQFTRYTSAPSTGAISGSTSKSGMSSRSRRKAVIKQLAGKRNTIHEDTYIFNSLVKIATDRLNALQVESAPLLTFCLLLEADLNDSKYRQQATGLQLGLSSLEAQLADIIGDAWRDDRDEDALKIRPGRPMLAAHDWRVDLLDLLNTPL